MFACATGPKSDLFNRNDPVKWVALLCSCHQDFRSGDSSNVDALHTLAHLVIVGDVWKVLLDYDIVPTLVSLLGDFDFNADIRRHGLNTTRRYLSDLLAIFAVALTKLFHVRTVSEHTHDHLGTSCAQCFSIDKAMSSFALPDSPMIKVLQKIWKSRTPLLDSERETMFRDHCNMEPQWKGLHGAICTIATQLSIHARGTTQAKEMFESVLGQAAKLCLVVWVYSVRRVHREVAMERMVSHVVGTTAVAWNQWYRQVATGSTTQTHIFRAFLRDLNDPAVMNTRLTRRFMIMTNFCIQNIYGPFNTTTERLLFWHTLASHRRQMCGGSVTYSEDDDPQVPDPSEIAFNFAVVLLVTASTRHDLRLDRNDPWMPLTHIHAAIPFIERALTCSKTDLSHSRFDQVFCTTIAKMITRCVRFVAQHEDRPYVDAQGGFSAPSPSMRRFSRKYWQDAKDWMVAKKYPAKPELRPVFTAWKELGAALQLEAGSFDGSAKPRDGPELPFAKRCAWVECLCSSYKPAHGFRFCKGCSAVAYCNSQCQRNDWKNHRAMCAWL